MKIQQTLCSVALGDVGFPQTHGAPQTVFADRREKATPYLDVAASSCPVLGWAEDSPELAKAQRCGSHSAPKNKGLLNEVKIVRHATGFVILKRLSGASAS